MKENITEWNRCREVDKKRRKTPCYFEDGISYDEFIAIANKVGKKIKRVKDVSVNGSVISCKVESQTGYSDWNFDVDFNDWGHITGTYWVQTENDDSSIPNHYGQMISGMVYNLVRGRNIILSDLSYYVDENKDLDTGFGLNYYEKKPILKKSLEIVQTV